MTSFEGRAPRASTGHISLRKAPGRHRRAPPFAVPNGPLMAHTNEWHVGEQRRARPKHRQGGHGPGNHIQPVREIRGTRASFPYAFGVTSTGRYPHDVLASGW